MNKMSGASFDRHIDEMRRSINHSILSIVMLDVVSYFNHVSVVCVFVFIMRVYGFRILSNGGAILVIVIDIFIIMY